MVRVGKVTVAVVLLWLVAVCVGASETDCSNARSTLTAYDAAIEMYASEHGLPNDEDWFESLVQAGLLQRFQPRNDPWGRPYYYRIVGDAYDLRTLGPDGKLGTDDDQTKNNGWRWKRCVPSASAWLRCGIVGGLR